MTVLVALVLYVIALFVLLLLAGGVRRGDEVDRRSRFPAKPVMPRRPERAEPWGTSPIVSQQAPQARSPAGRKARRQRAVRQGELCSPLGREDAPAVTRPGLLDGCR